MGSEKKINKLEEKLNSKREKIGNWKKAYEDIQALLTKSDEKLRENESFLEVERVKNSELIQKMNEKNESGQDEELNKLKNAILEKERRKYHRDIQQKRESQEAENKRLYEDLQRANIELKKADEIRNKLEENAETLKREKKR